MFSFFKKSASITTTELSEALKAGGQLLDVRTPSEFQAGHIAQAKNVPLNKLASFKGSQQKLLYVICQSGMRSRQGVKLLRKKGYQAVNVRGGMSQWAGTQRKGRL